MYQYRMALLVSFVCAFVSRRMRVVWAVWRDGNGIKRISS
jgi:hypothetical protein